MSHAPSVQYVTTSDGFDVAYAVRGQGTQIVFMPGPASHLQLLPSRHFINSWVIALSTRFRVIQYDGRGQGMSQRALSGDYGMDSLRQDLEAVLGALHLDRFILMGSHASAHAAVRYAIANPGRVDALILAPCGVSGRAWSLVSALDLARTNWDFFLATWTVSGDHSSPEEERSGIDRLRQCMTQQDWQIMATAWTASDIEELLPTLSTPTLLLHPRDYLNVPIEATMKLGSKIAGARLASFDGKSPLGDAGQGLAAIDAFLKDVLPVAERSPQRAVGGAMPSSLTPRQLEVLTLIAHGKTNREIAEALVLSERTVQRHIADLYLKIDVRNRAEATSFALNRLA